MKYSELQNKGQKELTQMLKDLKIKLGKLRFELSANTLKNSSQIRQTKKDIARTLTSLQNKNKMV